MNGLPNNLRYIRKSHPNKDLRSGNRVAELMNISPQYYYDLETGRGGRKLNIDHIHQLSDIFTVTADEILGGQELSENPSENKKIPTDLKRILEEKTVMFDGEIMNEDDKALIEQMLSKMYYKSKELNKRKK